MQPPAQDVKPLSGRLRFEHVSVTMAASPLAAKEVPTDDHLRCPLAVTGSPHVVSCLPSALCPAWMGVEQMVRRLQRQLHHVR